ncbi:hypothetical protein ACHAWF_006941 [Thalassiosira exigua]
MSKTEQRKSRDSNRSRHGGGGGGGRGGGGKSSSSKERGEPRAASQAGPADGGKPPHDGPVHLSSESLALARLRQKSISHPLQQCQLAVYVPPRHVGAVIGRGGRTILSVQREAMRRSAGHAAPVRISVLGGGSGGGGGGVGNQQGGGGDKNGAVDGFGASQPQQQQQGATWNYNEYHKQQQQQQQRNKPPNRDANPQGDGGDDWAPVVIRGDPVGCLAAARQLFPLVDREHDRDVVFEVPIHRAKHNTLVGKGGVVIAALSATYETRIMIPPNEFMSNVVGGGENFWKKREALQTRQRNEAGNTMLFGPGAGVTVGGGLGGAGPGVSPQAGMGSMGAAGGKPPGPAGTPPPNVIQLEGEIDKVEKCLVKMLSIVAGERWAPTGVVVENPEPAPEKANEKRTERGSEKGGGGGERGDRGSEKGGGKKDRAKKSAPSEDGSQPQAPAEKGKGRDRDRDRDRDFTTAEAVIVKVWTPSSKLLNLGKVSAPTELTHVNSAVF